MSGMNGYNGNYDPRKSWDGQPLPANNNPKDPDPRQTIYRLKNLQQQFNHSAHEYQQMASAVGDALALLEKAQAERDAAVIAKQQAQLEQRAALVTGMRAGTRNKGEFILLVDGSGSMNGAYIRAALDAAQVVDGLTNTGSRLALFGDSKAHWVVTQNLKDPAVRHKYDQTLNCGTDLQPSLVEAERHAAVNTLAKKGTHIVVVSDGDVFDIQRSEDAFRQLLLLNKKATVDFVIMGRPGTVMEMLAKKVEAEFPDRVNRQIVDTTALTQGTFHLSDSKPNASSAQLSTNVQDAVLKVVADRLAKPAAPKKKAAPQP